MVIWAFAGPRSTYSHSATLDPECLICVDVRLLLDATHFFATFTATIS
jgi:hypothetical protein